MAREYHVVNADGHVIEAPDLWERFLPKKYHDRAPKLVKDPLGGDGWQYEPGTPAAGIGNVTMWAGKSYDDNGWHGVKYDQINPGCFTGKDRLDEQDVDGVDAEVLFPPQRTVRYFMLNEDDGFHQAGVEAYNAWLYDDFCAADHGRLIGIAQMPNLGVETNIAALKQAKAHGFKGVICSTWPSGNDHVSAADDPFWEAAEAENMILHLHAGIHTGARAKGSAKATAVSAARPAGLAQMGGGIAQISQPMADLILSETFDRFPGLRMAGVEVGAGWVPSFLEHMDDHYFRNRKWTKTGLKLLPSEYFHRNWMVTFIREHFAVRNRHAIGIKNMMWSTDYPHHRCDWPNDRQVMEEMFVNVPADEKKAITCDNAVAFYALA